MMKIKNIIPILALAALAFACNKDDDDETTIEPPRDGEEVNVEDQDSLVAYLNTHFYNYEDFANPAADFDYKIVFDTIAGVNADKTPLMEQVQEKVVTAYLRQVNTGWTEDIIIENCKMYVLVVREGVGESPKMGHTLVTNYEGTLLDGTEFDRSYKETIFNSLAVVRGFGEVFPFLNTGSGFTDHPDGTITWNQDFGIGAVFMPSTLGYFNNAQTDIPQYSPLIFKVELLNFYETDDDYVTTTSGPIVTPDGIPTHLEDPDGDNFPGNDDTDGDGIYNYLDPDDDGDGVLTKYEYDVDEDGIPDDSNGNGIPDYLDPTWPNND